MLGEVEGDGGQRRAIEVYMLEVHVYWLEIDRAYNCQLVLVPCMI